MALHTRSQLATLVGKARAQVTTALNSGRLFLSEEHPKQIDDTDPRNRHTIEIWKSKMKSAPNAEVVNKPVLKKPLVKKPDIVVAPPPPPVKKPLPTPTPKADENDKQVVTLADKKQVADIARIKSTTDLNKLRSAKMRGETLPIDLVSSIIHSLGVSFQSTYKNGADQMLMQFNHKHKVPPQAVTELGASLNDLINSSHQKAISNCKKELANLISQIASVEANSENTE